MSYLSSLVADDIYSWDWYQRFFSTRDAQASQVVGDITPAYSMIPEKGVSYIKESLPNVKIIYIIREPVARAKSQIKMKLSRQAVSNDEEGWKSILKSKEIYSRGDYKAYIPRWKKQFNGSDLLFLPFGLIKSQPESLMRDVEEFLGLRKCNYSGLDKKSTKEKVLPFRAGLKKC